MIKTLRYKGNITICFFLLTMNSFNVVQYKRYINIILQFELISFPMPLSVQHLVSQYKQNSTLNIHPVYKTENMKLNSSTRQLLGNIVLKQDRKCTTQTCGKLAPLLETIDDVLMYWIQNDTTHATILTPILSKVMGPSVNVANYTIKSANVLL